MKIRTEKRQNRITLTMERVSMASRWRNLRDFREHRNGAFAWNCCWKPETERERESEGERLSKSERERLQTAINLLQFAIWAGMGNIQVRARFMGTRSTSRRGQREVTWKIVIGWDQRNEKSLKSRRLISEGTKSVSLQGDRENSIPNSYRA